MRLADRQRWKKKTDREAAQRGNCHGPLCMSRFLQQLACAHLGDATIGPTIAFARASGGPEIGWSQYVRCKRSVELLSTDELATSQAAVRVPCDGRRPEKTPKHGRKGHGRSPARCRHRMTPGQYKQARLLPLPRFRRKRPNLGGP